MRAGTSQYCRVCINSWDNCTCRGTRKTPDAKDKRIAELEAKLKRDIRQYKICIDDLSGFIRTEQQAHEKTKATLADSERLHAECLELYGDEQGRVKELEDDIDELDAVIFGLNCPHCSTHIDQHKTGNCANAWLWQLMGHVNVRFDFTFYNGKDCYIYDQPERHKGAYSYVPPLTTDYNVFFKEIVPRLGRWTYDHSKNKFYQVYERPAITTDSLYGPNYIIESCGSTFLEAGFRATVKYLSEGFE